MKKVLVGLSGGVDSSVSVILLQEMGYLVEACFMRNWDSSLNNDILGNPNDPSDICPQEKDYLDCVRVCDRLGVKLHRIDFVSEYWDYVFTHFLEEYKNFRTPNPDILCNKEIKFKFFLEKALELGYDYIAMGHFAQISHNPLKVKKGVDQNKDQTYFLSQVTKEQFSKVLFPVGHLYKKEIREIASKYNLEIASKKDSTGICFIGERNFKKFLENYIPHQKGEMKTLNGDIVGYHDGLMYYTIGQRHGLSLGGEGDAWFVIGKIVAENVLLVGRGKNHEHLYSNNCLCYNFNQIEDNLEKRNLKAKFRYRSESISCCIKVLSDNIVHVNYPEMFKAVTPGQAVAFYENDFLVGGAIIKDVFMNNNKRQY